MMMMKKKKKITSSSSSSSGSGSSSSSRSNVVVELTEDLILEICSHLSPVSLLQFKSVSKKWYSLISDPDFLCRHTLVHRLDPLYDSFLIHHSILLHQYSAAGNSKILILPPPPPPPPHQNDDDDDDDDDDDYRKISPLLLLQNLIDYRPEHYEKGMFFVLLDSCNGLLLYRGCPKRQINHIGKRIWYVCNPITHDYIKLPILFEDKEEKEQGFRILNYSSPNIVFDPSLSLMYKVVTWLKCQSSSRRRDDLQEHYRLYVYSSETRSWRLSISTNEFPVDPRQFNFGLRAVLCNGVLYWNALVPSLDASLYYDVEKDMISTLKFPNVPVGYRHRTLFYFGECGGGGGLRLIENYYKDGERINVFPSIFDVMELNVDQQQPHEDSWTVKYRVNIIGEEAGYYASLIKKNLSDFFILDLYKTKTKKEEEEEEEEEEELLLRIKNIGIISFNLSRNTFGKELRNANKKPIMNGPFLDFTDVLRFNTITLFPPSSSL